MSIYRGNLIKGNAEWAALREEQRREAARELFSGPSRAEVAAKERRLLSYRIRALQVERECLR